MKVIRGTIKQGKVELDAEGFAGSSCIETTRAYLESLQKGSGDADTRLKEEYHQTEVQQNQ